MISRLLLLICCAEAIFWMSSASQTSTSTKDLNQHLETTKAVYPPKPPTVSMSSAASDGSVPPPPKPAETALPIPDPRPNHTQPRAELFLPQDDPPQQTIPEGLFGMDAIKVCAALLCVTISAMGPSSTHRYVTPVALSAVLIMASQTMSILPRGSLIESITWFLNPFELTGRWWWGILPVHFVSKLVLDWIVERTTVLVLRARLLGSRDPANPGKRGLQALQTIDYAFLAINAIIEYIFTFHLGMFAWDSPLVLWKLSDVSLLNVLPALAMIFLVDDLVYAPLHRFMHWRPVYWLVHKHHHKQPYPIRGYFDAANESPVEQVLGLSCVWITLHIVPYLTGLHVTALASFFVLYAATAMLNHTAYDVNLWFGFKYASGAHEMHHRLPNCNFAQNIMLWDVLMGTFRSYQN